MVKQLVFCLVSVCVFSCNQKEANVPSDADVKEAIKEMYAHMSSADGGGGYHIDNIEVIEKRAAKDPDHYYVKFKATGTFVNPPLANPKPDKAYDETREEELVYKNGRWNWNNPIE